MPGIGTWAPCLRLALTQLSAQRAGQMCADIGMHAHAQNPSTVLCVPGLFYIYITEPQPWKL